MLNFFLNYHKLKLKKNLVVSLQVVLLSRFFFNTKICVLVFPDAFERYYKGFSSWPPPPSKYQLNSLVYQKNAEVENLIIFTALKGNDRNKIYKKLKLKNTYNNINIYSSLH